jgi:hypothetical protein
MLTDERLKQLMEQVGMPDSSNLYQALRQCDMEATLAERERCALICESFGGNGPSYIDDDWAQMCAAAIRDS